MVEICREFTIQNLEHTVSQAHADRLMDALLDLEVTGCGLTDSTVRPTTVKDCIEVQVVTSAATLADATRTSDWCIRAAVQSIGGTIAGWHLLPSLERAVRDEDRN